MSLSDADKKELLRLARDSIRACCAGSEPPELPAPAPAMAECRGVFVTLHQREKLRGCMGDLAGGRPLWQAVVRQARQAALEDPRFPALTLSDLPECQIEISALTELTRITDPQNMRMGVDGIYLVGAAPDGARRSGCYLPQVAQHTGWDALQFLNSVCRDKAGLPADAWRDPETELYIFQAEVFGEEVSSEQ